MVGKKKILAESFREMVWSELERKLTEEPAEQEGILFTEGVSEEGSDGLPDLGSIPPESFTERSLGTPKKESKDELIGLVRGLNGDSIGEKLTSLSGYLAHPPAPQTAGDVSNFILYVNAVKTLTSILTDFSPSSSGFLYEAFLAACVNGEQISGREIILDGEKLTNIADIKINGGFYGVKLNKNGVVSGSFRNLMATLLEHDSITYITSLKKITGEGLEIEGTVTTYEIPITSDNIIQLLTSASNPTNVSSMRTPQASFLEQLGDALDDPAAVVRAIQNTFQENNPKDADTIIWGDKGNTENVLKTFDLKNLKTTYGWQKGGKFKFNKTQVIGLAEQGAPIEQQAPAEGGTSAGESCSADPLSRETCNALSSLNKTWEPIFAAAGVPFKQPKLVFYSQTGSSGCGSAQSAMGPFYCPSDQGIYIDTDFYREMEAKLGAGGDFARAYVIAHEYGHHIQTITGISEQIRSAQQQRPGAAEPGPGLHARSGGSLR